MKPSCSIFVPLILFGGFHFLLPSSIAQGASAEEWQSRYRASQKELEHLRSNLHDAMLEIAASHERIESLEAKLLRDEEKVGTQQTRAAQTKELDAGQGDVAQISVKSDRKEGAAASGAAAAKGASPAKPEVKKAEAKEPATGKLAIEVAKQDSAKPVEKAEAKEPAKGAKAVAKEESAKPSEKAEAKEPAKGAKAAAKKDSAKPAEKAEAKEPAKGAKAVAKKEPAKPAPTKKPLHTVKYEKNMAASYEGRDAAYDWVLAQLKKNADFTIQVTGYANDKAYPKANEVIAMNRGRFLIDYLIYRGVNKGAFLPAKGEVSPKKDGAGRYATIEIIEGKGKK